MELVNQLRDKWARTLSLAAVVSLLSVSLAACGGDTAAPAATVPAATPTTAASTGATEPTATAATGSTGASDAQAVPATLSEWAIKLGSSDVKAGKVTFDVTNDGQFSHDLAVLDASGNPVGTTPKFKKSDGQKTLDVTLAAGTYKLICDIPGHADKGMSTTITVK